MNEKSSRSGKTLGLLGMAMVAIMLGVSGCSGVTGGGSPVPSAGGSGSGYANTISVTGSGEAQGTPDVAYIQLGIDVSDPDVGTAIQRANDMMVAVQNAVKGKGIEDKDLQTVNFNVYPEDIYDRELGQPTGERRYHVSNFLNIKIKDVTKIGEIIDAGLSAGATNVSSLTFSVEDPSTLESEARTQALKDAQERAQQLADGIGAKLGKPVIVSETLGGGIYYPQMRGLGGGGGGAEAAASVPSINPGQQTVSVSVTVVYSISQ